METSDLILDNLYLGPISSAKNEKDLRAKSITHILSVLQKPLHESVRHRRLIKSIMAVDTPAWDIMQIFPECFAFIDQARDNNAAVLVHCQAGRSRSATVVIAYIMHKYNLSYIRARDKVRERRPEINPNSGFVEQLQQFEYIKKRHTFHGSVAIEHRKAQGSAKPSTETLAKSKDHNHDETTTPALDTETDTMTINPDNRQLSPEATRLTEKPCIFKCKRCRTHLFNTEDMTPPHREGPGQASFDWRRKVPANQRPYTESHDLSHDSSHEKDWQCRVSLFVNPLRWMRNLEAESGKLHCPTCSTKIGSFVWHGEQCPCGVWVAPALHISWRTVDNFPDNSWLSSTERITNSIESDKNSTERNTNSTESDNNSTERNTDFTES